MFSVRQKKTLVDYNGCPLFEFKRKMFKLLAQYVGYKCGDENATLFNIEKTGIINAIGDVLRKLKQRGMTVVLVEQNFRFAAKVADRFYLMDHGTMTAEFPVSDLPNRMDLLHRELGV